MQKTSIGISIGLYVCLTYLSSLFAGPLAAILLVGYGIIKEENIWLKKNLAKVLLITFAFSSLAMLIGFIPSLIELVSDIMFFRLDFIGVISNKISSILFLIENALTLILACKALNQGTIKLDPIDKLIDKHFSKID